MRYAQIRSFDISNGEGIGIALFVQGCHFHCKDCFNQETWDFDGGKIWTQETKDKFMKLADRPYIQRISILGGEPLADENVPNVLELVTELKEKYPNKKIWMYTGYEFEKILLQNNQQYGLCKNMRFNIMKYIDVLCDGKFIAEQKDPLNKKTKWVGSTNQRVINIKETLEKDEIVLYARS